MDSPLVTCREPDEHIGEGVKDAFYKNLSTTLGDAQVIILENEEPPATIKEQIAFTGFTKNRTIGRYGRNQVAGHVPQSPSLLYLAAFGAAAGITIVSLDTGFSSYANAPWAGVP